VFVCVCVPAFLCVDALTLNPSLYACVLMCACVRVCVRVRVRVLVVSVSPCGWVARVFKVSQVFVMCCKRTAQLVPMLSDQSMLALYLYLYQAVHVECSCMAQCAPATGARSRECARRGHTGAARRAAAAAAAVHLGQRAAQTCRSEGQSALVMHLVQSLTPCFLLAGEGSTEQQSMETN